mgnify:CR=1 FL=1
MSLWDRLTGEFIDVIEWTDDTRDTMVWRFERQGAAIKYGAKLTVREGQAAVFVHEGQLADVFSPGLYMLETNNMPVMTTLQHWDHGFDSPFKSEIYFVSTRRFTDLKWGTKNPIMLRDPEFGPIRLRAFGTYAIRVKDPAVFLKEIVGTDGEVTTDEVTEELRNEIVARVSSKLAGSGVPVLDLAASTDRLGEILAEAIAPELAPLGVEIAAFRIENVSLPPEVEKALDRRTQMGIVGDLGKYAAFQQAEAMRAAAENQGGAGAGLGAGLGMGMGMAMANEAGQGGPWSAAPAAGAPPPPPQAAEKIWHLSENGASRGPFTKAELAAMAASGEITRATYVWRQGFPRWMGADEAAELSDIFAAVPPPPPV